MELNKKKIAKVIFHAGVHIGFKVLNSAHLNKDGVISIEMAVHNNSPFGVYITSEASGKAFEQTIPFPDILSIHYIVEPAPTKKAVETT